MEGVNFPRVRRFPWKNLMAGKAGADCNFIYGLSFLDQSPF